MAKFWTKAHHLDWVVFWCMFYGKYITFCRWMCRFQALPTFLHSFHIPLCTGHIHIRSWSTCTESLALFRLIDMLDTRTHTNTRNTSKSKFKTQSSDRRTTSAAARPATLTGQVIENSLVMSMCSVGNACQTSRKQNIRIKRDEAKQRLHASEHGEAFILLLQRSQELMGIVGDCEIFAQRVCVNAAPFDP